MIEVVYCIVAVCVTVAYGLTLSYQEAACRLRYDKSSFRRKFEELESKCTVLSADLYMERLKNAHSKK